MTNLSYLAPASLLWLCAFAQPAHAQAPAAAPAAIAAVPPTPEPAAAAPGAPATLKAGALVVLETAVPLSSKDAKLGQSIGCG